MTKYIMTEVGHEEFANNRKAYLFPTIRAKLMCMLSARVGYPLDSLVTQVKQDPILRARDGTILGEINKLQNDGYIEVSA